MINYKLADNWELATNADIDFNSVRDILKAVAYKATSINDKEVIMARYEIITKGIENDFDLPTQSHRRFATIDFLMDAGYLTSITSGMKSKYFFTNLAIRKGCRLAS